MNETSNPNGPYGLPTGAQIPSLATCKLSLYRDDTHLSTASGFLTEGENSFFIVTALHNFTGRDFFTRQCISPMLATPNRFEASVWIEENGGALRRFRLQGNLFQNEAPIFLYDWTENGGDIAIIEMPKVNGSPPLVTIDNAVSKNWTAFAGLDVFALGYASALDVNGTPIWKKVSIASEPSQKINGHKVILVDGLTYSGMSGGPVIINQSQGFTDDKNYWISKDLSLRVLGVYGGRFQTDSERSGTLGFFWPMVTIKEIIAGKRQIGEIE